MDQERSGSRRAELLGARLKNQRNKRAIEIAEAVEELGIAPPRPMVLETIVAVWWEHETLISQAALVRTAKKSVTFSGGAAALSRVIDPQMLSGQMLYLLPIRWPELGGFAVDGLAFEELVYDVGGFLDDEYWIASNHNDRLIIVSGERSGHRLDPAKITIFGDAWCRAIRD